MADPLSNPAQRREPGPGAPGVKVKHGGGSKRPSISVAAAAATRGKANTYSGAGTEDRNPPESGRARQDAANGTVHGQPLSHYNAGN